MITLRNMWVGLGMLVLALIGWLIALNLFRRGKGVNLNPPAKQITPVMFLKMVRPHVVSETMARIITAQAMLETGRFTSRAFLSQNNAFGYGGEGNLFSYASVKESIIELVAWLNRHNISEWNQSADKYAKDLKAQGYYTAPEYSYAMTLGNMLKLLDKQLLNEKG